MKNKKKFSVVFFVVTIFLAFSLPEVLALSQFDSPAETVIGQEGFGECDVAPNQGDLERGMYQPFTGIKAGEKFIVSDYFNRRVLIYNSFPSSNNQKPDVVIGQVSLCQNSLNQGFLSSSSQTIGAPKGLYFDGSKLFIADAGNHRVLIYNSIPTENNASADVVIGQPDFTSNSANQGMASASSNTLYTPFGVIIHNGKLLIADYNNNRVLIYNSVPTTNNASADFVIGQPDMTSKTVNTGGISGSTMAQPTGLEMYGDKLLVSDSSNHRVLIFNSIPASNGVSANFVIGQANMNSRSANRGLPVSDNGLYLPSQIKISNNKLYIADYTNNRILIYNSVPESNGVAANLVLGQADFTHNSANQGGSVSDNTLYRPAGIFIDNNNLVIADQENYRLLIFNTIPNSNNASADVVLGQKDFSSNEPEGGTVSSSSLKFPRSPIVYNNKLFLSDGNNNRILIYNSVPTHNNTPANVVLGQSNFVSNSANQGATVNANTLALPMGLHATANKLLVADYGNHRILIYSSIPTSNNTSADVEIGQTNMTSNTSNAGGISSKSLSYPRAVTSNGTKLVVADTNNNRVLIYNSIPTSNNASADVVVGQADFTHNSANQGGSVGANTLNSPVSVSVVNGKLIISDNGNQRVLIYNSIPTSNNSSADLVIGQPNLTSNGINQNGSVSSKTLAGATGVWSDGIRLAVLDSGNRRTLIFNTIPSSNNASADLIIGQENYSESILRQGVEKRANVQANALGVFLDDQRLFITDYDFHRILIYPLGPQGASFSAPSSSDSRNVNLSLTSTDAKEMMISENADFSGASWETFSVGKQFLLSKVGGVKRIYVKMRDWANYEGEVLSRDITLDNVKPVITNNQSQVVSAGTREVELSINTSKNSTCKFGVTDVGYDNLSNVFSTTGGLVHTSTISVSDGTDYRYYVKCEDGVGNIESSEINFSVSKTEYIPTISLGNKVINLSSNETAVLKNKTIGFKGTLSNSHLKLGKVELRKNGKFVKKVLINKRNQWRLSTRENLKERNITQEYQFVYYDSHNNIVETSNVYKILVDRKKPKIVSPGHQTLKVFPNQTITVNATDEGGIEYYQFTLRGVNYPKQESNTFTLPSNLPKGRSNLIVRVYDKAGNVGKGVVKMRY